MCVCNVCCDFRGTRFGSWAETTVLYMYIDMATSAEKWRKTKDRRGKCRLQCCMCHNDVNQAGFVCPEEECRTKRYKCTLFAGKTQLTTTLSSSYWHFHPVSRGRGRAGGRGGWVGGRGGDGAQMCCPSDSQPIQSWIGSTGRCKWV